MSSSHAKPRIVVVLLIGGVLLAGSMLSAAEQGEKKAKSSTETAKSAESKPPSEDEGAVIEEPTISPIYLAAREPTPAEKGKEVVITNAELERIIAGLPPEQRNQGVYQAERHIGTPEQATEGKEPTSSLQWMEQRQSATTERNQAISEAQKKVTELQKRVNDLEKRQLATKNPLLPRRGYDRQNEEDKNWNERTAPQRVQATNEELKQARAELATAQQELARLRASSVDQFAGSQKAEKDTGKASPAAGSPDAPSKGGDSH